VHLAGNVMSGKLVKVYVAQGISGSALAFNPRACDHYEERIKQAMAGPQ
jgi:hypothetical protein